MMDYDRKLLKAEMERLVRYWTEVGQVIIIDGVGVVIGRIVDAVDGTYVIEQDNGKRCWVNINAIVRIIEINGERTLYE